MSQIRQSAFFQYLESKSKDAETRLAAAAPDLLEALKGMVEMFEAHLSGGEGPDDAAARWDKARMAIAKAEGTKVS